MLKILSLFLYAFVELINQIMLEHFIFPRNVRKILYIVHFCLLRFLQEFKIGLFF